MVQAKRGVAPDFIPSMPTRSYEAFADEEVQDEVPTCLFETQMTSKAKSVIGRWDAENVTTSSVGSSPKPPRRSIVGSSPKLPRRSIESHEAPQLPARRGSIVATLVARAG